MPLKRTVQRKVGGPGGRVTQTSLPATRGRFHTSEKLVEIASVAAPLAIELYGRIQELERQEAPLVQRLNAGRIWLLRHPPEHPRRKRNEDLYDRLRMELQDVQIKLRDVRFAFMHAALDYHLANDQLTEEERASINLKTRIKRPNLAMYYAAQANWQEHIPKEAIDG